MIDQSKLLTLANKYIFPALFLTFSVLIISECHVLYLVFEGVYLKQSDYFLKWKRLN